MNSPLSSSADRAPSEFPTRIGFPSAAIVGRELERAIPSHRFRVDVLAEMGATLEAMQLKLAGLTHRPDAMIVYSGHNEFLGRYAFSKRVAYYDDDPLLRRHGAWQDAIGRLSPLLRLARENLDKLQSGVIPALNSSAIETVVGRPLAHHPKLTSSSPISSVVSKRL